MFVGNSHRTRENYVRVVAGMLQIVKILLSDGFSLAILPREQEFIELRKNNRDQLKS
jgi:hypothetical protein